MAYSYGGRRGPERFTSAVLGAGAVFLSVPARAYSTDSPVSYGCHEQITMQALRNLRRDLDIAPIGADRNERALIDDVPFDLDSDMHDLAAATLILANREVDLKGNEPDDLDKLATVHGNPSNQDEHCLRRQDEDEPDGSTLALADCRKFLSAKVEAALDGLSSWQGAPDPTRRVEINLYLDLRGRVDASLPIFYVNMGQALHTIQDSFTHSYRSQSDPHLMTAVLNYADLVEGHLEEDRDGPPHSSEMDRCQDLDAFRAERLKLATQASYDLMRAVLLPTESREQKLTAVNEVLDRYLTLDENAGCNASNHWCDAPEANYDPAKGCVCSTAGAGRAPLLSGSILTLGAIWGLGLRRKLRASSRAVRNAGAAALFGLLLASPKAHAQTPTEPSTPEPSTQETLPNPPNTPAGTAAVDGSSSTPGVVDASPVNEVVEPFPFGGYVSGSGSIQKGAFAVSAGVRYRLSGSWLVGIDGEYNPWFSIRNFDLRSGSTNIYAVGVLRFPLRFQRVNLRTTLELGVSRMNFDLYGVPKGSVGPFVGFNLLGVDIELSRSVYLVINPAHIALPIPQTSGVPYVYPQYRFTLGFQFGA